MNFFIERPIFASCIALVMVFAGLISMVVMPTAQFPPLVPPGVQVTSQYIGGTSQVTADTTTTPLEQQLNGQPGMIYMSSVSTNNGDSVVTCTFDVGFSQDIGQMELLAAANTALSSLPENVQKGGVTIKQYSANMLLAVNLISPNGTWDVDFLGNYGDIHVNYPLARIPGVSQVNEFGLRQYAMRIWLDPGKLTNLGLTVTDVQTAINDQNQALAAGSIGSSPAPANQANMFPLAALGRLDTKEEFENIVLSALPNGAVVRIKDVGRVELGSKEYDWASKFDGSPTASLVIFQLANANGLQIKQKAVQTMVDLERNFPEDLEWIIAYDTTTFITASIHDVIKTLFEAIVLVFAVVFIFLQSFRATLIPLIAVPVSLIGTFAIMLLFGFSINMLTLLGMVLAVALVVDDAIIIVENVMKQLEEGETDLLKATENAIAQVRGPIVGTTLVLMAVFIPVAFIPGMTGLLYNQFSLTIAISVFLSGINSLTLSPSLCPVLLRPKKEGAKENWFFAHFNKIFAWISNTYAEGVHKLARAWKMTLLFFLGLFGLMILWFLSMPTGFVPEEDQGYFLAVIGLPPGATIERTQSVVDEVATMARDTPGVAHTLEVAGFNIIDSIKQPNSGLIFVILEPWDERTSKQTQLNGIMDALRKTSGEIADARVMLANAPAIPGLGSTGGFTFQLQDLDASGPKMLEKVAENFIDAANKHPALTGIYTTYGTNYPAQYLDIDRTKIMMHGVTLSDVFDTLQTNVGSLFVNLFNKYGQVYRTYLMAEATDRHEVADIGRLRVRNTDGEMIPLNTFLTTKEITVPYNIPHYNMYPTVAIQGNNAPGYSSGQAIAAMEATAEEVLPEGYSYEWTGLTYQQLQAGNIAPLIFGMSLIFTFLVLAALYESWAMPMMVLLGVPLGLLGALIALTLRGYDLDVYGQIGLVMLIGLTAKNGILIVEFARDLRKEGKSILHAAMEAARLRLRPILMTAFAFVIGLIPLMIATGAGAMSRRSLGTTVVGGLALATMLIILVPIFYYVIQHLREGTKISDIGRIDTAEDPTKTDGDAPTPKTS